MSLGSLGLCDGLLRSVKDKGYKEATTIQKNLIPAILSGRDIIAGAQTGSGKTAGFALPILHKLNQKENNQKENNQKYYPKVLVLVPTRELARQIYTSFKEYGKYIDLRYAVLYGGAKISTQANRLLSGIDIIVATSGRLLEHIHRKNISLASIEYLVLDEADTILDMGFIHEISQIFEYIPKKRQNILISATLTPALKNLAGQILIKPKLIEADKIAKIDTIQQTLYPVTRERKTELLSYLIGSNNYTQVLLFVRKKELIDELCLVLNKNGLKSEAIHGGKSSGARDRALERFKAGSIRVLVASDIAARGLDIPSLEVVISYDIPHVLGDYIHRIGRTGRAGKNGLAIILSSPEESISLKDLERLLGKAIPKEILPEYAPEKIYSKVKKTKTKQETKKIAGAFGEKKNRPKRSSKKRKITKRDAWRR